MSNLVNSNFNRTYTPCGTQNALTDIKRLLTSRDVIGQSKACGYLIEVVRRYDINSDERIKMTDYLLDNDIIVFLCEATTNLNLSLFRLVLECIRLLWSARRFFVEVHAAYAMAAVLRSLTHFAATDSFEAVDICLHFLCDLLSGIGSHGTTSVLSNQSAYSAEQLLACLNALASQICGKQKTILCSGLVLDSLIAYQPVDLDIRARIAQSLLKVIKHWFDLLLGGLNHVVLVSESEDMGMFFVLLCQIGIDVLRLLKTTETKKPPTDFVQKILSDTQDADLLQQCSIDMRSSIQQVISEIIIFVKDYHNNICTEEYSVFLKFLLHFMQEFSETAVVTDFCDTLVTNSYLTILPQNQVARNDSNIRKLSILILGEVLKKLAEKYLIVNETFSDGTCANTIHMGLVELQHSIEKPQNIGAQLQKNQPYSLLIYMYFYCQSADKSEECVASLLPHLVEHILRQPKTFKPPGYIVKALWLVFAMSTISNRLLESLEERVELEKATDRLVTMLQPDPSIYYTHNPAILLWAFTSLRISYNLRLLILSKWLEQENSLPEDLSKQSLVWELLLNILIQNGDNTLIQNCMATLENCVDNGDEYTKDNFASFTWLTLPAVLAQALIDCEGVINSNISYLLEIAGTQLPTEIDEQIYLKVAVLITALFSKSNFESTELEAKYRFEYASLKLCLMLLSVMYNEDDNKVLLTFVNRPGFLNNVLTATTSVDDKVACEALQLLTYIVRYFTKNNYQPKTVLQIESDAIIRSLRRDTMNERGVALLRFLTTVLGSVNAPMVLSDNIKITPPATQPCNALKALLFRVQCTMCCKDAETQSQIGWKALSSIFKHTILIKNDHKLVISLSTQPWTFVLIRFQFTLNITKEFILFLKNWLALLKITLAKSGEDKVIPQSKSSLIMRTLLMIERNLNNLDEEESEERSAVLVTIKEILEK